MSTSPLLGDRLCRNGDGASKPYFFRTVGARCPRALYGGQGLAKLHKKLQNELIAQGYITSRVQFDVQAVPAGILKVRVHYGRIGQLRMQAGSSTYFRPDTLFPLLPVMC